MLPGGVRGDKKFSDRRIQMDGKQMNIFKDMSVMKLRYTTCLSRLNDAWLLWTLTSGIAGVNSLRITLGYT